MDANRQRIEWVDYLKTFACFLVVLGHLIQSLQKSNIDTHTNITSFINWFIYLFHMPLFMCMSGFLYCKTKKEFSWKTYKQFEIKKIINLAVPYFTFYLLFVGINLVFAANVNNVRGIEGIFNNPIPPYWFLYALLSIFIVIPLLEKCFNNENMLFTVLTILKFISIFFNTNIYFIDSIMAYGIYFYLGVFIKEEAVKEHSNKKILINLFCIIIYIIMSIIYYRHKDLYDINICKIINIIFAISGILICVNFFKIFNTLKILNTFKNYTFQIYLTHTIFAAGIRIVLFKLRISSYCIHFIIGLVTSIYIPVIMSIVSEKFLYTNFFFYPTKTIKELKERKEKNAM